MRTCWHQLWLQGVTNGITPSSPACANLNMGTIGGTSLRFNLLKFFLHLHPLLDTTSMGTLIKGKQLNNLWAFPKQFSCILFPRFYKISGTLVITRAGP